MSHLPLIETDEALCVRVCVDMKRIRHLLPNHHGGILCHTDENPRRLRCAIQSKLVGNGCPNSGILIGRGSNQGSFSLTKPLPMQLGKRNDAKAPQRRVRVPRQALRHLQGLDVISVPAEKVG